MSTPSLLPTTLVGSYPQPDWLIDRERLGERLPPRVRAQELWRVCGPWLEGRVSANRGWRAVNGSLVPGVQPHEVRDVTQARFFLDYGA